MAVFLTDFVEIKNSMQRDLESPAKFSETILIHLFVFVTDIWNLVSRMRLTTYSVNSCGSIISTLADLMGLESVLRDYLNSVVI